MDIQSSDFRGHKLVKLDGNIDFYNAEKINNFLIKFIKDQDISLILDLKQVACIDSAGIGLIVSIYKNLQLNNGSIALLHANNEIMSMLVLVTLDSLLKIYDSEDDIEFR